MKTCSRCHTSKEDSCFYPSRKTKSGLRAACKACEALYERDRTKDAANNKEWFQKNKTKRLNWHRKRMYGVTPEDVEFTFQSQERKCGICGTETHGKRQWHVDHDHKTNTFRGVLCYQCNALLGYAQDNTEILKRAISYLGGKNNVVR